MQCIIYFINHALLQCSNITSYLSCFIDSVHSREINLPQTTLWDLEKQEACLVLIMTENMVVHQATICANQKSPFVKYTSCGYLVYLVLHTSWTLKESHPMDDAFLPQKWQTELWLWRRRMHFVLRKSHRTFVPGNVLPPLQGPLACITIKAVCFQGDNAEGSYCWLTLGSVQLHTHTSLAVYINSLRWPCKIVAQKSETNEYTINMVIKMTRNVI